MVLSLWEICNFRGLILLATEKSSLNAHFFFKEITDRLIHNSQSRILSRCGINTTFFEALSPLVRRLQAKELTVSNPKKIETLSRHFERAFVPCLFRRVKTETEVVKWVGNEIVEFVSFFSSVISCTKHKRVNKRKLCERKNVFYVFVSNENGNV